MEALKDETLAMFRQGKMHPDPVPWEWDRRRENEQTPDYLGRVLDWAGLPDMARRAREGHFDDFQAPAEVASGAELIRLVAELRIEARTVAPLQRERFAAIENAARRGEFDATKAESDRWAASKSGQDTLSRLVRSAAKVGRNDLCPCGSGKKHKRCCGA
jgi:hypothetical protein